MNAGFTRIALFLLLIAAVAGVARADEKKMEDTTLVVLRTVDKLSARTHTFDIPVDKTVKFGNSLFIKVRSCRKASPLDLPESAAFLQIWERKPAEQKSRWLFSGWMFASSPSLSRLDHAVYDVWVIECKNATTSKSEEFSSETAPDRAPDAQPLTGKEDDIGFVQGAAPAPDKATERVKPEPSPAAAAPAVKTPGDKPAEKSRPPAHSSVPPLEKLPGSFDDGDGTSGGED
ncbi:MAG: DUF2155 domain-containing protein [Alphaproteobacteria bacterium]